MLAIQLSLVSTSEFFNHTVLFCVLISISFALWACGDGNPVSWDTGEMCVTSEFLQFFTHCFVVIYVSTSSKGKMNSQLGCTLTVDLYYYCYTNHHTVGCYNKHMRGRVKRVRRLQCTRMGCMLSGTGFRSAFIILRKLYELEFLRSHTKQIQNVEPSVYLDHLDFYNIRLVFCFYHHT